MTLREETKNMIGFLPESDVKAIYGLIKNLYEKESSPFRPLTKKQILADLAESRDEIESGAYTDFDVAINEIEKAYGL